MNSIELGTGITSELSPCLKSLLEQFAFGSVRTAFDVVKGGIVGGNHTGPRTGFDSHIAKSHAPFHGETTDGRATKFDDVAVTHARAEFAYDGKGKVFGGNAGGEGAFDADVHGFGAFL